MFSNVIAYNVIFYVMNQVEIANVIKIKTISSTTTAPSKIGVCNASDIRRCVIPLSLHNVYVFIKRSCPLTA